jgi:hypothetical protein
MIFADRIADYLSEDARVLDVGWAMASLRDRSPAKPKR